MNELNCSGRIGVSVRRASRLMAISAVLGVVALAAGTQPAGAVSLWSGSTGGSLTVDGLTITVTSCTLKLASVTQSSCAAGNLEMVAVAGSGAQIKIDGAGGGNIFSAAANSGLYDLSFTLAIVPAVSGSHTTVSSATLAMTGSAASTDLTRVSAGETIVDSGGTTLGSLSTNLSGPLTASTSFGAVSSFSVTKDLKVNTIGATAGDTLVLSSVSQIYNPAPEPVSIGLFLVGVAGIGVARRRRARRGNGASPV